MEQHKSCPEDLRTKLACAIIQTNVTPSSLKRTLDAIIRAHRTDLDNKTSTYPLDFEYASSTKVELKITGPAIQAPEFRPTGSDSYQAELNITGITGIASEPARDKALEFLRSYLRQFGSSRFSSTYNGRIKYIIE